MRTEKALMAGRTLLLSLALSLAAPFAPGSIGAGSSAQAQSGPEQAQPAFSQQELDQMLAPIALYPDALLSQILMASTYPLEVVQAARWSRAHPELKGDAAVRAAADRGWDPSVQSLLAFTEILSMMDAKLDWTQRLGDAFLAQEAHVMDTIQALRQWAQAAGNLPSIEGVRVEQQGRTIILAPVNPQVVYVPYYDPLVVYGAWWWPAPPVSWRPWPGYYARSGLNFNFYFGSGITLSTGFFFGHFDWMQRRLNVVHVNNYYRTIVVNRSTTNRVVADRSPQSTPKPWRHDPAHRQGIPYRDPAVRQQLMSEQRPVAGPRHDDAQREDPRREPITPAASPIVRTVPVAKMRPEQRRQFGGRNRSEDRDAAHDDSPRRNRSETQTEPRTAAPSSASPLVAAPPAGNPGGNGPEGRRARERG